MKLILRGINMEPTLHEEQYIEMIDFLKREIDLQRKTTTDDDYSLGVSAGREELAQELFNIMSRTALSWTYGEPW